MPIEELDFAGGTLQIRVPLHVKGRECGEYAGGALRASVFVADLNQVRFLKGLDIEAARQLASGTFDFGWALGLRRVGRHNSG